MSGFRVRREALPDDSLVVVRGGLLDEARIRRDATLTFNRFGEHGISVLAAADDPALDVIAATTLARDAILTVMTAGVIRSAGLELRPTFRRPHYTVMLPELDADISRLVACENVALPNPHFLPPEGLR